MSVKSQGYDFFVWVKQRFPRRWQEIFEDAFFLYFPVFLIKILTVEYKGYLRHYQLSKGDIVIDAGAWKGHFTIIASRLVGKDGLVIAIEPQLEVYRNLKNRLKRLRIRNVVPLNKGLYDEDTVKKFTKRVSSSFSVVSQRMDKNNKETETVILSKIDTILDEVGVDQVNFIKMDIEGAEIKALVGYANSLASSDVHFAIASYHIVDGEKTCFKLEQILKDVGYEAFTEFPSHLTTYAQRKMAL